MNSEPNPVSQYDVRWTHADFELAAALKDATEVPEAPASLYRLVPWRRSAGVLAGVAIPLLRHKFGKDPAVGTSVMLTSMTDAMGFFIFLGLASLFLLK